MLLKSTPLAGLVLLASLAASALAQKGQYEDLKRGYRLKVPDKWTLVPVQIDEQWIVAKFLSNKSYEAKARDLTEGGASHKPFVQVIWFSDEARKLRVNEETRGETTYISKNAPYRDYKDYLKRNLSEGYFFDGETEETEAGVACTKFQVKIDKNSSMRRRLVTWIFRTDDGELAVECEVLEDHYQKLEPMVLATLRSFKLIPKDATSTGPVTGGAGTGAGPGGGDLWKHDRPEWRKLSTRERQVRRKQIEEARIQEYLKDVPKGWEVSRTKRYLVLSHADKKFTKRLVDAAEAYREWLEATFDSVSDEYVMQGVIRVCADRDEAGAYVRGSGNFDSYNSDNREVVFFQDKSAGNTGDYYGRLFIGLLDQYMYDKDPLLYTDLPLFMHWALYQYVASAKVKGKKLILESDTDEDNTIRELERKNGFWPLKELMGPRIEDVEKREEFEEFYGQSARLLRFIVDGPGQKEAQFKGFMQSYMINVIAEAEALEAVRRDTVRETATTEAEEEQQAKDRSQYWKKRRIDVLKKVNEKLGWTDEVWAGLEKSFHEYLRK